MSLDETTEKLVSEEAMIESLKSRVETLEMELAVANDRISKLESKKERKKKEEQTDDQWMDSLKNDPAYNGIDVQTQYHKMVRWCEVNRKQPTRRRFINWLNRQDKPVTATYTPVQTGPAPMQLMVWQKELETVEKQIADIRNSYESHQSMDTEDREKMIKLKSHAKELKQKLGRTF